MKKISLNPKINMTLTEFKKLFKDHFKHIVPKDQPGALKAEYDRIMKERKDLDHDTEKESKETGANESTGESSDSKEDEQEDRK